MGLVYIEMIFELIVERWFLSLYLFLSFWEKMLVFEENAEVLRFIVIYIK